MKPYVLYASLISFAVALPDQPDTNILQKRDEDGTFSCYTLTNIEDFSALCPNINFPITNDRGLDAMGTMYFALASTDVPDDTVYNAQENIICLVNGETQNITATVGAGVGGDIVSAGASVSFTLQGPNFAGTSLCMFTEGTSDDTKNITDPITLAQARNLLYDMLTAPNVDCKTCGRIPIKYPQVQDGSGSGGGILKIDVKSADNCIGKCVGPNSFSVVSSTPSPTPSKSAGMQLRPLGDLSRGEHLAMVTTAWLVGLAGLSYFVL